MCRMAYTWGFQGTYTIYDLPELSALQRYYLQSVGVSKVRTASDTDALRDAVLRSAGRRLFIATWSLSEAPQYLREQLASMQPLADAFLIAYQDEFAGLDNEKFFRSWQPRFPHIAWINLRINHLPGNSYLFGVGMRQVD